MSKLRDEFSHPRIASSPFKFDNQPIGKMLLNFWQWSYSNLMYSTIRGDLAEYIVGTSLLTTEEQQNNYRIRKDGDVVDFWLENDFWVEVKSSSYVQAWEQNNLSNITFDIRPRQGYDYETNKPIKTRNRHAHVYVFALFKNDDISSIDPLNLNQWDFYVLRTEVIDKKFGEKGKLTLTELIECNAMHCDYSNLNNTCHEEYKLIGS